MKKLFIVGYLIIGILFIIIAGVYFITPANHLPNFLPGFDSTVTKTHFKHGIGALIIAISAFILAWFQSGKKSSKK